MSKLMKREAKADLFDSFDRVFDEWTKSLPFRRSTLPGREAIADDMIRVDEFRQNGNLVIRAELPGIDPDKDVEITVTDGMLRIAAEHREESKSEEKGYLRQELRYGSLTRTLPMPAGVSESDVKASYKDGILKITVPAPEPAAAKKIAISKGQ